MSTELWQDQNDEQKLADVLTSTVETIENSPSEQRRREQITFDLELYLGSKISSLYELSEMSEAGYESLVNLEELVFNGCYSAVETMKNRICSFRPRAQFLPSGGDYKARRAARDMTSMSDAWADAVDYQDEAAQFFEDLLTSDAGALKIFRDGDSFDIGRFPSWEFLVDPAEGAYGKPQCLYHVRYITIEQAAEDYDVPAEDLRRDADTLRMPSGINGVYQREMIRIAEAWSRGPDGRHVIVAGKTVVDDEDWEYDGFPVVFGRFQRRKKGFWGRSAIAAVRSIQLELNETTARIRDTHDNTSKQVHLVQENEAYEPTDANIRVVRYRNQAPQVINPPAVGPDTYAYADRLWARIFDVLGISQFIAAGTKQAGLNSAVAIREASELQTDRLALLSQIWERARVEAARWWWRLTRDLAKTDGIKPKWKAIQRGVWREMIFEDVEGEYEIRPFPSSLFGQTVSARLEKGLEMAKAGWISREDAMKAVNVPDLDPLVDLELAESYAMEVIVDDILEEGAYTPPDPRIDAATFFKYARRRYLLAISDDTDYPEQHLSLMRRLLDYLEPAAKAGATPAPAAPGPPPPEGGPMGPGAPVPPGVAPPAAPVPQLAAPGLVGEPPVQ